MWSFWRAWSVAVCAWVVVAQRIDQEPLLSPRQARVRDLTKPDEPSCDQLKAMWRFSKRQARAPEIMNEVSSYRDPLMYNEWPIYTALPRTSSRLFPYRVPHETYGRIITKAPPNVVRTPDYDQFYGMLNVPHTSGQTLRYSGPSKTRGPTFMVPPQRDRFEALKKLVRQEHLRELQRKYEAEQKMELKEIASGRGGDDYMYGTYGEQEPRGLQSLQAEYADEPAGPAARHVKKPPSGNSRVLQFSRYADAKRQPVRRTFYHPYFDYLAPEYMPYAY